MLIIANDAMTIKPPVITPSLRHFVIHKGSNVGYLMPDKEDRDEVECTTYKHYCAEE